MKKVFLVGIIFLNLFLICALQALAYQTESKTIETQVGNPQASTSTLTTKGSFVFYCQGAGAWMNTCSLGGGGCGPTSMAMILSTFGIAMTPPEVDKIFIANGWRSCSDAGSYMVTAIHSNWLKGLGFTVGPNLLDGSSFNIVQAKKYIDDGFLIIASSEHYPCVNCKVAGSTVSHIFTIDSVDVSSKTVSIRDPNNCNYGGGNVEKNSPIKKITDFPWYYAYPVKKG